LTVQILEGWVLDEEAEVDLGLCYAEHYSKMNTVLRPCPKISGFIQIDNI